MVTLPDTGSATLTNPVAVFDPMSTAGIDQLDCGAEVEPMMRSGLVMFLCVRGEIWY